MEQLFTKKWSIKDYILFILPSVFTMLATSLYTIVDGIFVSRFVGTDALAAVNLVLPTFSLAFGISIMLSTGSSALISMELGQENTDNAIKHFSLTALINIITGILLFVFGFIYLEKIVSLLGATKALLPYCLDYFKILLFTFPFLMLKIFLEYFLRVEGKADLALLSTMIGGIINIIFDYIFIVYFDMGIKGAGYGTSLGMIIPCIIGMLYFISKKSKLKFTKTYFDYKFIFNSIVNGSSEMVVELSSGITTFLFNITIVKLAGENGLAAITILLYTHFLLTSFYIGLTTGIQPVISFNYGAKNPAKIKEIIKQSLITIVTFSIIIFIFTKLFGINIIKLFAKNNIDVIKIANDGLKLFSLSFIICGFNILASGLFTAVNNGKISAFISFNRSFLFIILGITVLPRFLYLKGLWLTVPFAEFMTLLLSIFVVIKYKKKYL